MINRILIKIKVKYPLTKLDVGEMQSLKARGMRFTISAYHAEGLGHVSVMSAVGFFGLMKMDTVIVNPTEIDLPLYSYDRIYAMGNDVLITELYDTLAGEWSDEELNAVKDKYADVAERDPGEHWYDGIKLSSSISKKGKKKQGERMDALAMDHLAVYLEKGAPVSNSGLKMEKAKSYVDGLIAQGGPSTDVFKKALGEEKTRELFYDVLFGVC